jgi:hypothetical protein
MQYRLTIAAILVFVVSLSGCGKKADVPDQMTLYSIDPGRLKPEDKNASVEKFYRWKVLGKLEISDAAERAEIFSAVKNGITEGGMRASCFDPRHGLRVVMNNQTTDYVICFACSVVAIHQSDPKSQTGKTSKTVTTSSSPQPTLNKYLKQANIPLAPEW